ncbi:MAG: restriction endonuclease subunit S [Lachnospiraceae bacterium]|jgi:type I restriction enzyme S subunit
MARGKKKETLTPEERLQAALVPESEQPYEVPKNWCWIRLGSLLREIKNGTTIKQDKSAIGYKVTRIESLQNQTIDFDRLGTIVNEQEIKDTDWYGAGDIALSHINSAEHVGKTALINANMLPLVHGMNLLRLRFYSECFMPLFFQYFSQSFQYKDEILSRINMAVNQVSINQKQISSLEIPLPPFPEQQRIVDRIESLFAKLDEAKQKAQDALDSFETRKAAILHKAFTGELTAQWRKEHGVGMESWKKSRFDEVATIKSNLVNPLDFPDLPHIAPDNIEKKTGVLLEYHTVSEDGVTSGKHRFYPGQILYTKIRPYLSKVVVVDFNGLCSADMYPIEAEGNARCLWYYMLSEEFLEQASSAGSRSVLPKINQKELSALTVVLPALKDEQEEIVRILDDVFAKEQQAKEAAEGVLEQIDLIKKTILARAFRGELGTNDPSEESAGELVKQISSCKLG